jgi:CRP-like cAMP-binding protein
VFRILDFLALLEAYGCVGIAVSRMLLKQLRTTASRMVERSTLSAAGRIHAELLRLARLGDGRSLRPTPVLAALAVRVHSTRETVSRTIHALERRGLIRREAGGLVIVAPGRLEDMIV